MHLSDAAMPSSVFLLSQSFRAITKARFKCANAAS